MASTADWRVMEAGRDDLPRLMPVMRAAFDPRFGEAWTLSQCEAVHAMPGCQLAVIDCDGTLAGFAMARTILDETELLLLAVDPGWQRRGIGAALLGHIIRVARESATRRMFLEVRTNNPALQFYELMGFVRRGLRRDYYRGTNGETFDAITLSQDL